MKNALITIVVLALVGAGIYYFISSPTVSDVTVIQQEDTTSEKTDDVVATTTDTSMDASSSEMMDESSTSEGTEVIGTSAGGNNITTYHYGTGDTEILFVGGIHGGYEWNTSLLAFTLMDYLDEHPEAVPENVRVSIIPVLNPDGLATVLGSADAFTEADAPSESVDTVPGRFNGSTVDLNRNFDCDWQTNALWQKREVSGGDKVFSEPESQAVRDYVATHDLAGAVVWYSAAGGVFSSSCHNGPSDATRSLTQTYAEASGYKAFEDFNYYKITGDMVNWLAKKDIPAISVLLTDHRSIEWQKNKEGVLATINYYSKQ